MSYRTALDTPDHSESTGAAQWEFLRAINQTDSSIVADLRKEPFDALSESGASLQGYTWQNLEIVTTEPDLEEHSLAVTRVAIKAWAERWHLTELWILESACDTLEMWRTGTHIMAFLPKVRFYTPPTPLYSRANFPEQLAQYLHNNNFIGYDPTAYRGPSDFKKQLAKLCEQFAAEHVVSQTEHAERRGYQKWRGTHKEEHFKWAVLRQVHGYSAEAIAEALGIEAPSVQEATKNIFRLIGFEPRKLRAGRPAGNESKDERKRRVNAEIHRFLHLT